MAHMTSETSQSDQVLCNVLGCERPVHCRNLCQSHYKQLLAGRSFTPIGPYGLSGCTFPGCEREHRAKGFCAVHYEQQRLGKPLTPTTEERLCEFDGCDRRHYALGFCQAHYGQMRRGRALTAIGLERLCSFEECENKHSSNGFCSGHYAQQRRGEPLTPLRGIGGALSQELAYARATAAWPNFQHSVPFTRTSDPWPGVCQDCGQPVKPRLDRAENQGCCPYCSEKKVDDAIAVGKMMAVNLEPLVPYPGSLQPWKCRCLNCDQIVHPRFNDIDQGGRGCSTCSLSSFDENAPAIVYVVASEQWLKLGITNSGNEKERLSRHRYQGLSVVLHIWSFDVGREARALEKVWLAYISGLPQEQRATKSDISDGYTETTSNTESSRRWLTERSHLLNNDARVDPC